jgi:hydroxyacylglutathione hydrolase
MGVRLQMAGTGSAFAKKYYNNNALIYTDDHTLMIDFGITAPASLFAMNKKMNEINGVLITHLHGDHVGGLEELAFQMKYMYGKKPTIFISPALIEPLWENSLKAGMENAAEGATTLASYFDIVPIQEKQRIEVYPGLTLEIFRTDHIPHKISYSLFLNDDLFYSADTVFNQEMLEYVHEVRKCKYILHDCQLQSPGIVHAALEQLLTLPDDIQEKIYLMHYGDDMESFRGRTGKMTFLEQHTMYDFI